MKVSLLTPPLLSRALLLKSSKFLLVFQAFKSAIAWVFRQKDPEKIVNFSTGALERRGGGKSDTFVCGKFEGVTFDPTPPF